MADLDPADTPPADTPPVDTPPVDPPAPDAPPADTPPADAPPADPPASPPVDDWRARIAGDDKSLLGYLARVPSEKALAEQVKKYNDDVKNGRVLKPMPENPTDDEIAAYRKDNGIPDKPEGYLEKLPDGLVVGEDDRPFVDEFLSAMHEKNAPPALAGAALSTYYKIVEDQAAAEADRAREAESVGVETLREEYGADYKRNLNAMHQYLDTLPEPVANAFKFGKGGDGLPLGYSPDVLRWLVSQALDANPLATVVPGAGANQASAVADEIAALEKRMETDRNAYFKDEKAQARYIELLEARDKIAQRGG